VSSLRVRGVHAGPGHTMRSEEAIKKGQGLAESAERTSVVELLQSAAGSCRVSTEGSREEQQNEKDTGGRKVSREGKTG
jgi:hypothetical protein